VAPAPRVKLSESITEQATELLTKLPPLPVNWRPTNPEQLAFFNKHRAK
jgi:hypothetical protein